MGFFSSKRNEKETCRKVNLRTLEDKRLAFAKRMREEGFSPDATLYIQREGGFWALAKNATETCILFGPGPGEDADFACERFKQGELAIEMLPAAVEGTGMGGAFGFGTKGAVGFTYRITRPSGAQTEITLLSGIGTYLETSRKSNQLLSEKRARGDANFVWSFSPGSARDVTRLGERWLKLLTE